MRTQPKTRARSSQEAGKSLPNLRGFMANQACTRSNYSSTCSASPRRGARGRPTTDEKSDSASPVPGVLDNCHCNRLRAPHKSDGSPRGPSTCTSSLGGSLMLRRCALGSSATSADAALRRQDVLRVSHGAGPAAARRSRTRGASLGSTWRESKIGLRERGANAQLGAARSRARESVCTSSGCARA